MKKVYIQPIVNVENAMPTTIICTSLNGGGTGLIGGGGSDGEANAPEWDVWGDDDE